jgi:hypothetical protein
MFSFHVFRTKFCVHCLNQWFSNFFADCTLKFCNINTSTPLLYPPMICKFLCCGGYTIVVIAATVRIVQSEVKYIKMSLSIGVICDSFTAPNQFINICGTPDIQSWQPKVPRQTLWEPLVETICSFIPSECSVSLNFLSYTGPYNNRCTVLPESVRIYFVNYLSKCSGW